MSTPTLHIVHTHGSGERGLFLLATDVLSSSYLEMEHSTNYHAQATIKLSSYQHQTTFSTVLYCTA